MPISEERIFQTSNLIILCWEYVPGTFWIDCGIRVESSLFQRSWLRGVIGILLQWILNVWKYIQYWIFGSDLDEKIIAVIMVIILSNFYSSLLPSPDLHGPLRDSILTVLIETTIGNNMTKVLTVQSFKSTTVHILHSLHISGWNQKL